MDTIDTPETDLSAHCLPVLVWPDKRLNKECADICNFDNDHNRYLEQLILDMAATMNAHDGIGLAAPQVGILANFIVLKVEDDFLGLANPEILETADTEIEVEEGCLSVPGYYENRRRPSRVVVKYNNITGEEREIELTGLWAFALQHEIDHLHGKVFVDSLSYYKRSRLKKKIAKLIKQD